MRSYFRFLKSLCFTAIFMSIVFTYLGITEKLSFSETLGKADSGVASDLPLIVLDESSPNWFVDRFAGNTTAGPYFFPGTAVEVGGLDKPTTVVPLPDGTVCAQIPNVGVVSISLDGDLRLIVGQGGTLAEGPVDRVVPGIPAYNPANRRIYLTGPNCIRRIIDDVEGRRYIEIVAGIPGIEGFKDGPLKEATFTEPRNIRIDSKGVIYFLDTHRRLRRICNGLVETLNGYMASNASVDGALKNAKFQLKGLEGSGGGFDLAGDDVIYVADFWARKIRKIDLKKMVVMTIAGVEKGNPRFNRNADGPGLTHASFNSGISFVRWDPVHQALWCGGPDENRLRWLKDGWVRTVVSARGKRDRWEKERRAIPGEDIWASWPSILAVDSKGQVYMCNGGQQVGLWRIYQKKKI